MGESSLDVLGINPLRAASLACSRALALSFYPVHQMKYSLYMITHVYHVVCIVQVKAWILTMASKKCRGNSQWESLP
jgi:hypothetical protein